MAAPRRLLSYREFGNPSGGRVLVSLAGFPDNETSGWSVLLEHFQLPKYSDYRVICLCLPDFEDAPVAPPRPWGYTLPEILALIDATITHLVPDKRCKVTLAIHDWGAYYGLMYENAFPARVERVLCFDVAAGISKGKSQHFNPYFIVMLYQLWWATAYWLSQAVHASVGKVVFLLYGLLVPAWLRPTSFHKIPRPAEHISVRLCYPYFQFWRLAFSTKDRKSLAPKPVTCPILFLYGTDKNVFFHTRRFLADIDARTDGSRWLAIEGASHWLVSDPGPQAQQCLDAVDAFLGKG